MSHEGRAIATDSRIAALEARCVKAEGGRDEARHEIEVLSEEWRRTIKERDGLAREVRAWRAAEDELRRPSREHDPQHYTEALTLRRENIAQGWPSGG